MVSTFTTSLSQVLLCLALLLGNIINVGAQTTLINNPGITYANTGGVVSDTYGPVDISNCTSVAFTFSWDFSLSWEGVDDMDASGECGACVGDPDSPDASDCNNCWDFVNIQFIIDGTIVSSELIGEDGTTDAEQSGTYTDLICTDGLLATNGSIEIQSQTWDAGEEVTYSNITLVCYEGAPTVTANPDPVCSNGILNLDGVVTDPGVIQSSVWVGAGNIADPGELRTTAEDVPGPNQNFSLEVTDINGCTASANVNVSVTELFANPTDAIVICVDRDARRGEILNQPDVEDQITGGDPNLTPILYFDADATRPIDLTNPASVQELIINRQTEIFGTVSDGTCESDPVPITLDPADIPEPEDQILTGCADSFGSAEFDLNIITDEINLEDPDLIVTYHETEDDALNDLNPLPDFITTDDNNTFIYARTALPNGCAGVAEVRLAIEVPPTAGPAVLSRCDEGFGQATFDLTEAAADVDLDALGEVIFYTDPAATPGTVINTPESFNTTSTVVYGQVVTPNQCVSNVVEVELIVVSLAADQFSLEVFPEEACGAAEVELIVNSPSIPEGDFTFNITYGPETAFPARTEDVLGTSGSVVLQVEAPETYLFVLNSVTSPDPSACPFFFNNTPTVIATINEGPPAFDAQLRACEFEFGEALFDLTTLEDTITRGQDFIEVRFYEDEFLFDQIPNPLSYQSRPGFVYAIFEDPSGCFSETAEIELIVDLPPQPIDFALDIEENCGPAVANVSFTLPANQMLDFNFTLTTPTGTEDVTLTNITQDSIIGIALSDTTTFTLVSVTNATGCVFAQTPLPTDTVIIRSADLVATPTSLALCDASNDNSQQAIFDLTSAEATISGSSGAPVRWFRDVGANQPITNVNSFPAGNNTRIFALLDGPCPSPPVPIDLLVNINPEVNIQLEQAISCASVADAILQTTVANGTEPFMYDWSNDAWDGLSRVTGVGSGVFQLILTDANACQGNADITVAAPTELSLSCNVLADVSVVGATDGQGGYDLSGGSPPYTYQLTGATPLNGTNAAPGSYTLDNLAAGNYTLTISDSRGCQTECIFTIVNPDCDLVLDIAGINPSCNGRNDGRIDLTVTSSFAVSNIDWNNDIYDGVEDPQNVIAGNYAVGIIDANGCTASIAIEITEPAVLAVDCSNVTNASAIGVADGSLTAAISGGTAPYDLTWSGPVSGSRNDDPDGSTPITGLSAGSYSLDITDANGCTTRCGFTINEPGCDLTVICSPNEVGEGDGPGSHTYTISGGTAPYRVVRTGPAPETIDALNMAGPQSTGLIPTGDYELTITDANGCTSQCSFRNVNCDLMLTCSPNAIGEGDGPGSYTYTIIGGTAPYRVVRTGPAPETIDALAMTGPQSTGLIPTGDYELTITDADGCMTQCNFRNVNCDLMLTCTANGMGEGNGPDSYTFTFSGGTGDYNLELSGPSNLTDTSDGSMPYVSPVLESGDWTFTVVDADGCSQSCSFMVEASCELTASLDASGPTCPGSMDGTITVVLTNGMAPYTFDWSDDQYDSVGAAATLTNLPAGDYALTVTDAAGCVATASAMFTDLAAYQTSCTGDVFPSSPTATDGEIVIDIMDGPGGPYTITYDNGVGVSGSQAATVGANRIIGLANGTYNITISNAANCTTNCQVDLFFVACTFEITSAIGGESCMGANDGEIIIEPRTGQAPYAYSWSNSGTGNTQTDLAPGTYAVTITDANTCAVITNFTVSPGRALPTASFASGGAICPETCFDLAINLSGITGFSLAYEWVLPNQRTPAVFNTDELNSILSVCPADEGVPPGDFELIFTSISDDGCAQDLADTVRFSYQAPVVTDLSPQICTTDSLVVEGEVFDLENPTGQVILSGVTETGCDSTINVALQFFDPVSVDVNPEICRGGSVEVGGVVFNEGNPTGTVTLTTINGCDSLINVTLQVVDVVTEEIEPILCPGQTLMVGDSILSDPGTYAIEFPGGAVSGCDSLVTVELSFYEPATGDFTATLCPGESITIGDEEFNEANPTGDVVFSGASAQGCDSLVSVVISFFVPDTARLEPTVCIGDSFTLGTEIFDGNRPTGLVVFPDADINGCDSFINVTLSFFATDTTIFDPILCAGQSVTIGMEIFDESRPTGLVVLPDATVNGCDSLVQVALNYREAVVGTLDTVLCFGASIQVGNTVFDATNPNGDVILPGASTSGCDSLVTVNTTYVEELSVRMPADQVLCGDDPVSITVELGEGGIYDLTFNRTSGGTITEEGVAPPGVSIDLGVLTQDETITLLSATSESNCPVNILDAETEIRYSDTQLSLLSIGGANGVDLSCTDSQDGAIAVEVTGGVEPFTYQWSNGAAVAILDNLSAGTYTVSVTDQSGCTVSESLDLQAPLPIVTQLSSESVGCFGTTSGRFQIDSVVGGTGTYTYQVIDGLGGTILGFPTIITNLVSGDYEVEIMDTNGCTVQERVVVPSANELVVQLAADTTIVLGQSINLEPSLNFTPVGWSWAPSEGLSADSVLNPIATPQETVEYTLTTVDEFGCTVSESIFITVNKEVPIYVPNAFSPNGDGNNDALFIFADDGVEAIERFLVFDRWGNQVFERSDFAPNDLDMDLAWNGIYRGQALNQGVFIYVLEYRLINDEIIQQFGEILLVR